MQTNSVQSNYEQRPVYTSENKKESGPLLDALCRDNLVDLQFLINYGTKLTTTDKKYLLKDLKERNIVFTKSADTLSDIDWLMWASLVWESPDNIFEFFLNKAGNIYSCDDDGKDLVSIAIYANSINKLKSLLKKGAPTSPFHYVEGSCCFPLKIAIAQNDCNELEVVKLLLEYGADINQIDEDKYNVVALAILHQKVDVLQHLLSLKDQLKEQHHIPLHLAIRKINTTQEKKKVNFQIIDILIRTGADVNEKDSNGYTSLYLALMPNILDLDIIKRLLEAKADPNILTPTKTSLLSLILYTKTEGLEATKLLFRFGANPHHEFCSEFIKKKYDQENAWAFIKIMLENGMYIPQVIRGQLKKLSAQKNDRTVFEIIEMGEHFSAVYHDRLRALRHLLKTKVSFSEGAKKRLFEILSKYNVHFSNTSSTKTLDLLLWVAILIKSTKAAKILVEYGADIHSRDDEEQNLLQVAIDIANLEAIELLLESTKDPYSFEVKDKGLNIVDYAIRIIFPKNNKISVEIGKMFIKYGIDINKKNSSGLTPLHTAILIDNPIPELTQLLLDHGANPNEITPYGVPLTCITNLNTLKSEDVKIARLLLEYGAFPDQQTCDALYKTALKKSWELTRLFLKYGLLPPFELMQTLKEKAKKNNDKEIISLLDHYTQENLAELAKTPGAQQIQKALEGHLGNPNWNLTEKLLKFGAQCSEKQLATQLEKCVSINNAELTRMLLGFDRKKQLKRTEYLSLALKWGSLDTLKALLEHTKIEKNEYNILLSQQLSQIDRILDKWPNANIENLFAYNRCKHLILMTEELMQYETIEEKEIKAFNARKERLEKLVTQKLESQQKNHPRPFILKTEEAADHSLTCTFKALLLTPKVIPPKSKPIPIPKRNNDNATNIMSFTSAIQQIENACLRQDWEQLLDRCENLQDKTEQFSLLSESQQDNIQKMITEARHRIECYLDESSSDDDNDS